MVAMKQKDLKFLSQSILLEEQGLPKMSLWIIMSVFLMLTLFIGWSILMNVEEIVIVNGEVIVSQEIGKQPQFRLEIPSYDGGVILTDQEVMITVLGSANKKRIQGFIQTLNSEPLTNESGNIYYEAIVVAVDESEKTVNSSINLMKGMPVRAHIITGKKSLFEYFIGPIIQVKNNALREK